MKHLARAVIGALLALAAITLIGAPAHAADAATDAVAPAEGAFVLTLDVPQLLNLLIAVIFPVLVGLVTTKVTSSTLKAVLLATISLASGLVSALLAAVLAGVPFDVISAILTGLAAWIIAIATHLGFWKPSGVTEKVQAVGITSKE